MKKFLFVLFAIIIVNNFPKTYCNGSYAKVIENNVCLYKNATDENSIKNIICILENTYYVQILLTYDEDFYKVNYNGVSGYVLRKSVKKVAEIPENPYPNNISIITVNNNIYLRNTPEKSNNNHLTIIPSNSTRLKYIGKVYGEQLDDFRQNIWYFVEYEGIQGYIYSEYISSISNIKPNIEQLSFLNTNDFDNIINPLSDNTCAIIIVSLLLPCLLILFLIYKKPNKKKEKFKEKIVIIKEYDENL